MADNSPATFRTKSYFSRVKKASEGTGFIFIMGFVFMLVPVVGWIAGPMVSVAALGKMLISPLLGAASQEQELVGDCPYCGLFTIAPKSPKIICPSCRSQYYYNDGFFRPVT